MDNPCAKVINGVLVQCSKRLVGCAINCIEWKEHVARNQERYDANVLNSVTKFVPNFSYIKNRMKRNRGKYNDDASNR